MRWPHSPAKLLLSFGVLTLLSCKDETNSSKTASAFDLIAARSAIEQQGLAFSNALKKEDSAGLANFYTRDAKILNADEPATAGRDSIKKAFGEMIRAGITGSSFTTTGLWGNDSLLVEEGIGVFSNKNGKVVSKGKYLVVWKREDGAWKLFRDMYNSDGVIK